MGESEAAVDLGLVLILRREKVVEFCLGIDLYRVRIAKMRRPVEQILLDLRKDLADLRNKLVDRQRVLLFDSLIAT